VFSAGRAEWLLAAALPAAVLVALPARTTAALPLLLVLTAGGPVLVATAPGPATVAVGLALTLAAAGRSVATLDTLLAPGGRRPAASALSAVVAVASGLVGLGLVALLGAVVGVGSGLTLLALPVMAAALGTIRLDRASTPLPSIPLRRPGGELS